eukprot:5164853-Alexandrium_andersonii.AAC.1
MLRCECALASARAICARTCIRAARTSGWRMQEPGTASPSPSQASFAASCVRRKSGTSPAECPCGSSEARQEASSRLCWRQ